MVVNNFDVVRIFILPNKADAVLVVDPDALLSFAVALERLQPVARRHFQIVQLDGGVENGQPLPGRSPDARRDAAAFAGRPQSLCVLIPEAHDHALIVMRLVMNAKRYYCVVVCENGFRAWCADP